MATTTAQTHLNITVYTYTACPVFLIHKNVYPFTCIEQTVPHDSEVHRSLKNSVLSTELAYCHPSDA
jgi:hypothetical protein